MSSEFIGIEEAIGRKGLRLVVLRGLPSPWSQAARGILHVKGIDYAKVQLGENEPRERLNDWTGQDAFPAAMFDDERPRTGWEEILWLAERLAKEPSLVPAAPVERAEMFGLSREICGEMGLGWCRRLVAMGPALANPEPGDRGMGFKYGSSPSETEQAQARILEILRLLDARLVASQDAGGRYLMGDRLTALDIYWATFSNLVQPMSEDRLPLAEPLRSLFTAREPEAADALGDRLIAHRDFVYETHLELPVEL